MDLRHSYSKKGYPYDNASMESFNAILKKEELNIKNEGLIVKNSKNLLLFFIIYEII